ncbi:MAG: ligase-associated DNA damage response DEXH box helicase [Bacteroidia bacterium]
MSIHFQPAKKWFKSLGWNPQKFQLEAWEAYLSGKNGLVNAPTGSGKTYSVFVAALLEELASQSLRSKVQGLKDFKLESSNSKLKIIWITPIRALAKEIELSGQRAIDGLGVQWRIGKRTGDTSTKDRAAIKKSPPDVLITTPESLHLMLASKKYPDLFKNVRAVVCDEWHELVGSKRGVQMELALSRLKTICPQMKIWGISATIGNMDQAAEILFGSDVEKDWAFIKSDIKKEIDVESIFPKDVETLPWAGHLGVKMLDQLLPILDSSKTTLIFTNTRSQTEIWYQKLLEAAPQFAGIMAMHHGSMSRELRDWVEDSLHEGLLKVVVCTSSLDLGVDFRPVETIIQVGSPKGVARFLQRAGRSGHQPGAKSRIYFLPTHSLELVEGAALRVAAKAGFVEDRMPYIRSFDVLIQYLVTLAVSDGFKPQDILPEIQSTFSFNSIDDDEWNWCLNFITSGGESLNAYDEFHKVIVEEGVFKVINRRVAMRHRLSIGTIVSDAELAVRYQDGKFIGTIEERFITRLLPGDVFVMAGLTLEFIRVKEMTVQVKPSKKKKAIVPSWGGGRMPLSAQMSEVLRNQLFESQTNHKKEKEVDFLKPLFESQKEESIVPTKDQFLIECFISKEGHHLLAYPFEGRFVNEGLASLLAYRISLLRPITFSIAMNDYGFELLSDSPIDIEEILDNNLLSAEHLTEDIMSSVNSVEIARHKFRDIASISGLVFKGFPGKQQKEKHIQSSAQLFFDVFADHEPDNLLLTQAYDEVMTFQLEEHRMRKALERIAIQEIVVTRPTQPTPFAFPIMVDRLRGKITSEKLEDRIAKMALSFE